MPASCPDGGPAGAERRRYPRYHVVCPLDYTVPSRDPRRVVRAITGNLGAGGLLARLPERLDVGTALILDLELPTGRVRANGIVIRVEEPGEARLLLEPIVDHGVQFSQIAPPMVPTLERFLQTLEEATRPLLEP